MKISNDLLIMEKEDMYAGLTSRDVRFKDSDCKPKPAHCSLDHCPQFIYSHCCVSPDKDLEACDDRVFVLPLDVAIAPIKHVEHIQLVQAFISFRWLYRSFKMRDPAQSKPKLQCKWGLMIAHCEIHVFNLLVYDLINESGS